MMIIARCHLLRGKQRPHWANVFGKRTKKLYIDLFNAEERISYMITKVGLF